ncbi:MAG: serpin family protein [Candidatus Thermoplasmatota archaeon]|nr:serpin family protein [Candidatus Thermoplasmatota archaeon]
MKLAYLAIIVAAMLVLTALGTIYMFQNQFETDVINNDIPANDDIFPPLGNMTFQDAVNSFGFTLFQEIFSRNTGNQFVSPYSIFTALAMTYEGARGDTADEMATVLNIEQDNTSFHTYVQNLYNEFNAESSEYNLSTANALWVRKNLQLLDSYLSVIRDYYGGDATEVDFTQAVMAAAIINRWVENQTNKLIKNLVPADAISPSTGLILTNAIYFKGIWKTQFESANTTDRPFTTQEGSEHNVPAMQFVDTHDWFNYGETDEVQILELPYTGDSISMVAVLPKETYQLSTIIDSLDTNILSEWLSTLSPEKLDIYLPKFKVESSYSLAELLAHLGMQIPFTPSADFSGITGAPDLFISNVLHKAYIDVNEEGTEAAAATAVIMELTAHPGEEPERIIFDCDHPFLYMILHKETGTILFMGTINDPTA